MENNPESIEKEIKVNVASPEDVRGMQEVIYKTWLATYPNKKLGITVNDIEERFKAAFTEGTLAKRAERISNPAEGETLFFAKESDKVVGICCVVKSEENNRLQAIYVLPEYQGRGVGKLLWDEAQKVFDPEKDTVVAVATYNTQAIDFYERLGFSDTGRRFTEDKLKMKSGAIVPEMEMEIKS